jgi:hypothetical protein
MNQSSPNHHQAIIQTSCNRNPVTIHRFPQSIFGGTKTLADQQPESLLPEQKAGPIFAHMRLAFRGPT